VRLPDRQAFEAHLRAEGLLDPAAAGLKAFFGETVLDDYAASKSNPPTGEELVFRALKHYKGSSGAAVARAIVAETDQAGQPKVPAGVRELLERAGIVLGLP
jgi:hypothetical protein